MSGARGCSPSSPADGRTLPPLPAPGGMATGMLCHQHMLKSGEPQHPHIPSPMSPPLMLWEFVCVRRKRGKKKKKKVFRKSFIFLTWGHTQPSRGGSSGAGTRGDAVRQRCSSHCPFPLLSPLHIFPCVPASSSLHRYRDAN